MGDRLVGLVVAARPRQWVKNVACLAGLVFSGRLFEVGALGLAALAFAAFCLASSSIYLINDVCDRRSDAENPKKRHRPIASGRVSPSMALGASITLMALALAASWALPAACRGLLVAYLAINVAYSIRLKHTVLVDVILIAIGFEIRILFGVYAVGRLPTAWIVLCMFFLALFLGFAKRRAELGLQAGAADDHRRRPVLEKYRTNLLDLLLAMSATMAITCYALYTVTGRPELVLTVPLVVYGFFRYLLLVIVFDVGDAPDRDLFSDPLLIGTAVLWVGLCVAILYGGFNPIHFEVIGPAHGPGPSPPAVSSGSR